MALLGWTPEGEQEYLPDNGASKIFDIERCSKSPSMFDVFKKMKEEEKESVVLTSLSTNELAEFLNPKSKLNWLSNKYIRDMDMDLLLERIQPFIKDVSGIPSNIKSKDSEILKSILSSIRVYLDRLIQAPPYIVEFFVEQLKVENEDALKIATVGNAREVIKTFYRLISSENPLSSDDFKAIIEKTGVETGEKGKTLYMPIRVGTTGTAHGLELPVLFSLLGVEKLKHRMESLADEIGLTLK
jgi:glutamyl-tRNA synthetase/nondiscriminating glutamyl-tRNA synthetase